MFRHGLPVSMTPSPTTDPAGSGGPKDLKHLELLDCARGVAIIGVLLCHTLSCIYGIDSVPWRGWFRDFSNTPFFTALLFPLSMGQAGVAIFFVISGFCIHLSFRQRGGGWGQFFVRRLFRIWPAYVPALLLFVELNSIGDYFGALKTSHDRAGLFSHLFLVHNYNREMFTAISGSFWSLAVEAQLYVLYPVFLLLLSKLGWRVLLLLLAVVEIASTELGGLFGMLPFAYWFSWALGARLADAFVKNEPIPFPRLSPLWPLALAISLYFFRPLSYFWFTAWAITAAIVFGRLLNSQRMTGGLAGWMIKIFKSFGLWSYSLYLLHHPLLTVYYFVIVSFLPESILSQPVQFAVVCLTWAAIIPFSILWFKCFEVPGIQFGKWVVAGFSSRHRIKLSLRLGQAAAAFALIAFLVGTFLARAEFSPKPPVESNNLAWELATSPDAGKRNGNLAVKFAEQACQQTGYETPVMVGTLAAAYAEAGRFDDAVRTASLACTLAARANDQKLVQSNRELLNLYLSHQAYHRAN